MREILRAVLKTGSGSASTLLLGMVTMKIMAVVLGPSGVGLYSILRQAMEFSSKLGTFGGQAALVQGLASRKGQVRDDYIVTTFWIFVLGALLITVMLVMFAPWIAPWVFGNDDGQTVTIVRALALPAVLGVALIYFNGVLNGFRAIGLMALFQALGAAATVLLAYPISRLVEIGYPIAFIIMISVSPAVGVSLSIRSALRAGWLAPLLRSLRIRLRSDSMRHFLSIAITTSITDMAAVGTVLAVRSLVVHHDGLASVGIFAVAWTLSMTYVMLILASFGTYYLPTLSQTSEPSERVVLMRRVMRLATLLMVPLVTSVIVLKPLMVQLLYSDEFAPSLEIIRWMLIGDYLKVASWVLAMPALAYLDMRVYFWTELLWNVGFLAFAALALFGFSSMQGIGIGFLLMYVGYLTYYAHYTRSRHRLPLTRAIIGPWLLGLALVGGASWHTWSDTQVNWIATSLWIGAAVCFSWLSLNSNERTEILHVALRRERHYSE